MYEQPARDTRPRAPGSGVTAVLGPTNTGKTHLAVERMLGHRTGMIGLPLRLLAREVYDRIVSRIGAGEVALITGEEKIVPASPRYFVSTVEAMPLDIPVEFLAIDEIQLAADAERGHVFTDRLLGARGTVETMLLGAATMHGLILRLLPGANFISRPRFSRLTYSGSKKLTRLGWRSAVVAFSADRVYAIAELIRRQRGGAAVILGALSPRTRNAQIELYQAGDVDFLVASDAIGMGLNMDVDHVSFAARRKFDGLHHRNLAPAELAQIAGRAGRHMNDGTFGTSGDDAALDGDTVDRIENHRFEAIPVLQWRNTELDFRSLKRLIESLSAHPNREGLMRTRRGDDFAVLDFLSRSQEIVASAGSSDAVTLLWEVSQLPDYRKVGIGEHAGIVSRVFQFLTGEAGVVPEDWMARQVAYADRTDGDIDTLANRIAHIRTWTFVANRSGWLGDAKHWREMTRAIEDKLSDALHEQLTQRFVDRRTSVLMKRLREKDPLLAGVSDAGEVVVEGEYVGRLDGLRFSLDGSARPGADSKALQAAAMKVLSSELTARAQTIVKEDDSVFSVTDTGYVTWRGTPIARLEGGESVLKPQVRLVADEQLLAPDREQVAQRVEAWLAQHLRSVLAPLFAIAEDGEISGLARGIGFQLVEHLGLMSRESVASDIHQLDQQARGQLRRHGVRFGAFSLYAPALLKPHPASLRLVLFRLFQEASVGKLRDDWPEPPQAGLTSLNVGAEAPEDFYAAAGYRLCGPRAVRADMLERLGDAIRPLVGWKPSSDTDVRPDGAHGSGGFTITPLMMSLVGCSGDDFGAILTTLGFRREMKPMSRVIASAEPQTSPPPKPASDSVVNIMESNEGAPSVEEAKASEAAAIDGGATETVTASVSDTPVDEVSALPEVADVAATPEEPSEDVADKPDEIAAADAEPAGAREEPTEIAVWFPRSRHNRARRGERSEDGRPARQRGRGGRKPAEGDGKEKSGGRRRGPPRDHKHGNRDRKDQAPARPRKRQSENVKDSPFAALLALKEQLESDSDRPPT